MEEISTVTSVQGIKLALQRLQTSVPLLQLLLLTSPLPCVAFSHVTLPCGWRLHEGETTVDFWVPRPALAQPSLMVHGGPWDV